MRLRTYMIRRAVYTGILLIIVAIVNFAIFRVMPGDPALLLGFGRLDPSQIVYLRQVWGLDRPMTEQFVRYITSMFQGNFGYSFVTRNLVSAEILARLPNTLLLVVTAITLASAIALYTGVISGACPGTKKDLATLTSSLFLYSIPVFWTGMILLYVFGYLLRWFPLQGTLSRPPPSELGAMALDIMRHLFLPVITLALSLYGGFVMIVRNSMLEVMTEDYIVTARAKGLKERTVLFGHALRNARLPFLTILALQFGSVLSGSVLVETVFSWYGLGTLIYTSVLQRDYPVLQAIFFIIAISVVLANFLADVLYARLDPRITYTS